MSHVIIIVRHKLKIKQIENNMDIEKLLVLVTLQST